MIGILFSSLYGWKGEQNKQKTTPAFVKFRTDESLIFSKVIVFLRDGRAIGGMLIGVEGSGLIVRIGNENKNISVDSLKKVIIKTETDKKRYLFQGALVGAYLGNLIIMRAKDFPAAYFQGDCSFLNVIYNILFVGAGGSAGYVRSALQRGEKTFEFTENRMEKYTQWERLKKFVLGGGDSRQVKKFHVNVQGGYIFSHVSDRYFERLKSEASCDTEYTFMDRKYLSAEDFNLLRRLQLTYSVSPGFETGLALLWAGELPSQVMKEEPYNRFWLTPSIATRCYCAVGVWKPFYRRMPRFLSWRVGAGVGLADVQFELHKDCGYYYQGRDSGDISLSKIFLSGVVFTECHLNVFRNLSIGISADYVLIPSTNIPGIPESGIPAVRLAFGNGCIGFSMGFHY